MRDKTTQYYQKAHFFLMCCLATFPLTPKGVHSTLIITVGSMALLYFLIYGRKDWTNKKTTYLISLGSISIIYCLSLLHLADFNTGMKFIVRTGPIFLLPFTFLNYKNVEWNIKKLQIMLCIYVAANLFLLFFLHISFFNKIYNPEITPWEMRGALEESIGVHGTYLSMWIGIAIMSLLWFLFRIKKNMILQCIGILLIGYFYYWQYVIGARMPFFATLVTASFLFLFLLKVPLKTVLITFLVVTISGSFVFSKQISAKITELANYETAIPAGKYESTNPLISNENIRSVIYHCSLDKIKEKPWLGYGIGDVDQQLQDCYDKDFGHTDIFKRFYFNSHSQYLLIILSSGFIGLILYLTSCFLLIKWSLTKVELYVSFLILIFLCFTFENILSRHDGVIFFSFFNTILFFAKVKEE